MLSHFRKRAARYIKKDVALGLIAIAIVLMILSPLSTSAFFKMQDNSAPQAAASKTAPYCGIDEQDLQFGTPCGEAVYLGTFKGRRLYTLPEQPVIATWHNGYREDKIAVSTNAASGAENTQNLAMQEDSNAPYRAARICAMQGPSWYLPSRQELQFIYHLAKAHNPAFLPRAKYWSSSVHQHNPRLVHFVDFSEGLRARSNPPVLEYYVKCIRSD